MTNKQARMALEELYGEGCFMERAGIRKITPKDEKKLRKKIKGYKKLSRAITYHHIVKKCDGGKASVENGANLAEYNHVWLHQQSPQVQNEINKKLQEFKLNISSMGVDENGEIIMGESGSFNLGLNEEYITIRAYDDRKKPVPFDREEEKRKLQKAIKNYENGTEER